MTVSNVAGERQYFVEMFDHVRAKLARLPADSLIKRCFPEARLDVIGVKIAESAVERLERGNWQPAFLFLKESSDAAIQAFDDDLRIVESRSATNDRKLFDFLASESESAQPWVGGVFEIYVKATMLRSREVSNVRLDWTLPNGRRPDLRIELGPRSFCIECTSLGESDASEKRWAQHNEVNPGKVFVESRDSYTQSRRVYAKVFDKIAPQLNIDQSQLNTCAPNLLMISLYPTISYLTSNSPAVRWALDELLAGQPTGNDSPASLCEYLRRKRLERVQQMQPERAPSSLGDLLRSLAQVSGIFVFDRCKLGSARINDNAGATHAISHSEMAVVERLLSTPPLYAQQSGNQSM